MGEPQLDTLGRRRGLQYPQPPRFGRLEQSWRNHAACVGLSDRFFVGPGGATGQKGNPGKAICAGCPVAQDCLDYALATNPAFGIWGGLTYKQRQAYARRQRREAP